MSAVRIASLALLGLLAPLPVPPAERSGFEATPSYAETLEVIGRYAAATPSIRRSERRPPPRSIGSSTST